jgi:threonine/homoserine/homoserine lactone efflux protein
MLDYTLLSLFIPTFFLVSVTPGMCMTLAMTLGMTIGVKKTLWMMLGEVMGVGLVALLAGSGVSTIMLAYPAAFTLFKVLGASYLLYIGVNMFCSKGKMAIELNPTSKPFLSRSKLFNQGFMTAVTNPKGWAFMVSLLPPFINPELTLSTQLVALISIILLSEFICMVLYAAGGRTLGKLLNKGDNVKTLNKISGGLMMLVAIWLVLS